MKIKTVTAILILLCVAATGAYAFGLGVQANFCAGGIFAPGVSLLVSPADAVHFAFNWYLDFDNVNIIGLTLDLSPLVLPITTFNAGSFNFTLGIGLFANMVFSDDPDFNSGLRLPVGFNLMLGRRAFEIFTHVAPSFGVHFLPGFGLSRPFFPIALGARFWIR